MFGTIVRASRDWEEINQGISSLTRTGMIEESELERKFVYALKRYAERNNTENLIFKEVKENGIQTYRLTLPIKDGFITYAIRPQISLGEKDGLSVSTRPDFFIKCVEIKRAGEVITDIDELLAFKNVAIYLDGYTYHASEKHMRFYEDIEIRDAIVETPNIVSWSLSWTDVLLFENEDDNKRKDAIYPDDLRYRNARSTLKGFPISRQLNKGLLDSKNSIERLLWYLKNSNNKNINSEIGLLFASLQDEFGKCIIDETTAQTLLDPKLNISDVEPIKPSPDAYMKSDLTQANELFKSRVLVRFKDFNVKSNIVASELKEIDKGLWEEFLRIYSLLKLVKI